MRVDYFKLRPVISGKELWILTCTGRSLILRLNRLSPTKLFTGTVRTIRLDWCSYFKNVKYKKQIFGGICSELSWIGTEFSFRGDKKEGWKHPEFGLFRRLAAPLPYVWRGWIFTNSERFVPCTRPTSFLVQVVGISTKIFNVDVTVERETGGDRSASTDSLKRKIHLRITDLSWTQSRLKLLTSTLQVCLISSPID